jgi:hypothetical protein
MFICFVSYLVSLLVSLFVSLFIHVYHLRQGCLQNIVLLFDSLPY